MRYILSCSLLTTVYWSRNEGGIEWSKVFGVCPWMTIRLRRPSFLNRQTPSSKSYSYRESLILQYRWHWNTLVQRFKKIEMEQKKLLTKANKCYRASNFFWKNKLARSLFWHVTNFCWIFLSKVWMSEVYFSKIVTCFQPLTIFKN